MWEGSQNVTCFQRDFAIVRVQRCPDELDKRTEKRRYAKSCAYLTNSHPSGVQTDVYEYLDGS